MADAETKKKPFFYDINDVPAVNLAELVAAGDLELDGIEYFEDRLVEREILNLPDVSFIEYTVAPGTKVPAHHHDCDQVDYILRGELRYGNRVLTTGMGFFAPEGSNYTWTAGPEGCTFLEVHNKGEFQTLWRDPKETWPPHDTYEK